MPGEQLCLSRITSLKFILRLKSKTLEEVRRALEDPKVWDAPEKAQELGKQKKALENVVTTLTELDRGLSDSGELFGVCEPAKAPRRSSAVERGSRHVAGERLPPARGPPASAAGY